MVPFAYIYQKKTSQDRVNRLTDIEYKVTDEILMIFHSHNLGITIG